MKLSVIMPSHAVGRQVNSNILNVVGAARENVEVLVRDNSGDSGKAYFLAGIQKTNCRIFSVPSCNGIENLRTLIDKARGDYVWTVCDDDYMNNDSVSSMLTEINRIKDDERVIGTTGLFVFDAEGGSYPVRFNALDVESAKKRVTSFFNGYPSILQFSPIKRTVLSAVFGYLSTLPVFLSYHDLLANALILSHGRMTYVERFIYQYKNTNWNTLEKSIATDAKYVKAAGLDESGAALQWLICALEGVRTFEAKYRGCELTSEDRKELADFWGVRFFQNFIYAPRIPEGKFSAEADVIAKKWRARVGIETRELLEDIAGFYALSSPALATSYREFWK